MDKKLKRDWKYAIIIIIIIALILIAVIAIPQIVEDNNKYSIKLDETLIQIGNNSSGIVSGNVEGLNEIILYSKELNLNESIKIENEEFSKKIDVPLNVENVNIGIYYKNNEGEEIDSYESILITRLNDEELNTYLESKIDNNTKNLENQETGIKTIIPKDYVLLQSGEPAYEEGYFAIIEDDKGNNYYLSDKDALKIDYTLPKSMEIYVIKGTVGLDEYALIIESIYGINGNPI